MWREGREGGFPGEKRVFQEEDEDAKLDQPSKDSMYDKDGLLGKLRDVIWPEDVPWIHTLSGGHQQEVGVTEMTWLERSLSILRRSTGRWRSGKKKKMEEAEERKKARESTELAKEVWAQKRKESAKQ
ncbi:hypothetical protein MLD38_029096 [Melastoma candidum]|uniref:Uncharacterized protein n=1 Tax=Melastoma candidum TaxID=119954 RepID=A0ACB9N4L2_9MYRT|nr:hypothetical protein MLD38_029096 [Melastoma candidum]